MRQRFLETALGAMFALGWASAAYADKIVLVAGGDQNAEGIPATQAKLRAPFGVAFDAAGTMYLVELAGQRVLQVDKSGILKRIAGTGEKGNAGDGGPPLEASFNGMHSLAVTSDGQIYLADTWNNRVRAMDATAATIQAFAGTGTKAFGGDDGAAAKAQFAGVFCIALVEGKSLYVADLDNRRIRKIDLTTGLVTTVAGNGKRGVPMDGTLAVAAPLVDPRAVAVDAHENVYILERSGNALRVVDKEGKIRTVVGTGKPGSKGDGGPALQAELNGPKHLCVDKHGDVLIADTENHLVRKYIPAEERIVRIAGTGKKGSAGIGGPPLDVELNQPHGVCVHADGTLYIVDSSNDRVLHIDK